ncbi:sigma-E processing peptidase SpoIIGA [Paenibacillus filicis]|uniref:Sporulation sigma-E factor-processing peptidase n=1 Tax=Paenibacillus gyeongsangnamensis TaxID=3388067 RepID=A0ABT4Q3F8_9BACL|nr:sigma-E processing peptidase SpoIIGA [Paenibacillus filicis]MCZ8511240.1 sigma-E processing peptidase SpoIIGA [Paenibacillus filicis]
MIVYIDIIFLVNLLIDGMLLWMTARTRKLEFKWWRVGASSAIGAMYVVLLFFPPLSFLYTFGVKFLLSLLMLLTAFGFGGMPHFMRNVGAFYVVNFVAAGLILGANYFWESSGDMLGEVMHGLEAGFELKIGLFLLVFSFPFAFWLYRQVTESARRKEQLKSFMAKVDVYIDEFASTCTGLIDTGNQLYDPLTKTPVMVMEAAQWGERIPDTWMQKIRDSEVDQLVSAIGTEPFVWQDRLRLVPYRGVNRGMQFMLAIKPDRVIITTEDKQIESIKVLIGLDGGRLSSDNAYQAIIHPSLLQM